MGRSSHPLPPSPFPLPPSAFPLPGGKIPLQYDQNRWIYLPKSERILVGAAWRATKAFADMRQSVQRRSIHRLSEAVQLREGGVLCVGGVRGYMALPWSNCWW